MPLRPLVIATVLVALVVAPTIAVGAVASNSKSYPDSTGETPGAPDITSTTVANDDSGMITFKIKVNNRRVLTRDMLVQLFIDTKTGAGDPANSGADWVIQLVSGTIVMFQWKGSTFKFADEQALLGYTYTATGPAIVVNAVDLGAPKTLRFQGLVGSGASLNAQGEEVYTSFRVDLSPARGAKFFEYPVVTRFALKAGAVVLSPARPRAGGSFAVGLEVTQNDTGGPVVGGNVTCRARLDGQEVKAKARRLRKGVAVCAWAIPAKAAGQRIVGSISVSARGVITTKSFSARIL